MILNILEYYSISKNKLLQGKLRITCKTGIYRKTECRKRGQLSLRRNIYLVVELGYYLANDT